jgi:hypothetical protein
MNLILEVGLNHFGKVKESIKYLKFFLKSNFTHITYQVQKESYYEKFKFKLPISHYIFLINKIHKKGKKIGLAVADINSCYEIAKLNFDLAVAPLQNNIFNRCKSEIKFSEYEQKFADYEKRI